VASDVVNLQSCCIAFAHYTYRYRIGIGLQQNIGESVSVENDVLGLTLATALPFSMQFCTEL